MSGFNEQEVSLSERGLVLVIDMKNTLGVVEIRSNAARVGSVQPEIVAPVAQHSLRRPPAHAAVDHRRSADAASLGEQDRRVAENRRGAGIAIQSLRRTNRVGVKRFGAAETAFFEDQHIVAGVSQARRCRRTAGAAADHNDIATIASNGGTRSELETVFYVDVAQGVFRRAAVTERFVHGRHRPRPVALRGLAKSAGIATRRARRAVSSSARRCQSTPSAARVPGC